MISSFVSSNMINTIVCVFPSNEQCKMQFPQYLSTCIKYYVAVKLIVIILNRISLLLIVSETNGGRYTFYLLWFMFVYIAFKLRNVN